MHLLAKIGISVAVFAAICLLELLYEDALFNASLEFIINIQADTSYFSQRPWKLFSSIGFYGVMWGLIWLFFVIVEERSRCFYYLTLLGSLNATSAILKLINHQPRPYWVSPEI